MCFYSLVPVTRHIRGRWKSTKRLVYSSPSVNDESATFLSCVVISKELSASMFRGRTVARKFKKPALLARVLLGVKACILEFIASNSSSVFSNSCSRLAFPVYWIHIHCSPWNRTVAKSFEYFETNSRVRGWLAITSRYMELSRYDYCRRRESSFNRLAITRFFCLKDRDKKNLCCFVCTFKKTLPRTVIELDISFTIGFIITVTVLIARKERVFCCGLWQISSAV